ncbi:hypothetical protein [Pyrococcus sp. ST04]|uniref:hypothetical protein n=1 Tax=Pyrococcus sp. ST04 TaxID=1183377 RepID=UPI0002605D48|nr:hypothetical protein [Pyrococcus sp. ST04]AFK22465.1 hypothetical protein Py04_0873 [Pyrococcus sp. ST04]
MNKDIEEILKEKDIVKKAYLFGFYIGLHGHVEWIGWVAKIKKEIYLEAKSLGVYELAKLAYKEGKEAGKIERERRIHEGLMKREENLKIKKPIEIVPVSKKIENKQLLFPKNEDLPGILKEFKGLKLPRFLKGGIG